MHAGGHSEDFCRSTTSPPAFNQAFAGHTRVKYDIFELLFVAHAFSQQPQVWFSCQRFMGSTCKRSHPHRGQSTQVMALVPPASRVPAHSLCLLLAVNASCVGLCCVVAEGGSVCSELGSPATAFPLFPNVTRRSCWRCSLAAPSAHSWYPTASKHVCLPALGTEQGCSFAFGALQRQAWSLLTPPAG